MNWVSNGRRIITISIAVLIFIASVIYGSYSPNRVSETPSNTATPEAISDEVIDELYENEKSTVQTMHDDHSHNITKEDIRKREEQLAFAAANATEQIKKDYPGHDSISIRFTEWYLTEENDDLNILVATYINSANSKRVSALRVVRFKEINNNRELLDIYKPDSRYDVYDN